MGNAEFIIENEELKGYSGQDEKVVIPEEVSVIGFNAFSNCNTVITIEVPETVQCISEGAFWKCDNLTEIIFKGEMPDIEDGAILACNNLRLPADWFHTDKKLPVGLIDCIRTGKENCNIAPLEVAWIVLFQGKKWEDKVDELLLLSIEAEAVGMGICSVLSNYPKLNKKIKDTAIHFMAENYLYKCLIILVNRYLNLSLEEMDSYIAKYDDANIIKIFQMMKQQKFESDENLKND